MPPNMPLDASEPRLLPGMASADDAMAIATHDRDADWSEAAVVPDPPPTTIASRKRARAASS